MTRLFVVQTQRRKTETKPDTYNKDRIFVTSFAFCVITYEPIEVQTFSAPQNDRQNLVFVKDIKVVVEKMTRNRRKVIGKPGDSLLCRLHSIQLSSLVYSFLYAYALLWPEKGRRSSEGPKKSFFHFDWK